MHLMTMVYLGAMIGLFGWLDWITTGRA